MSIAPIKASRSWDFVQSLGVNTHISDTTMSYGNLQAIGSQLAYLGINHVRDLIPGAALGAYKFLAVQGIQFDLEYPSFAMNSADLATQIKIAETLGSSVFEIEGPNEPNINGMNYNGLKGVPATIALTKDLYAAVQASPILTNSTHKTYVLAASLSPGGIYAPYGDLSPYADFTNVHAYAQYGVPPYWAIGNMIKAVTDTPGRPPQITETGTYTLINHDSGVSEAVQAKWDVDVFLEAYAKGVVKTYMYQLQDVAPDPTGSLGAEFHYGLFNVDGTPKLAAFAIHNLTTILQDTGPAASTFVPGSLPYTITGMPYYGFQNVTQKSNGTFDIAIWAEPRIWDSKAGDIVVPPSNISVNFSHSYAVINVYDLLVGTSPVATYRNTDTISISLGSDPLIVEVVGMAPRTPTTIPLGASGTTSVSGAVIVQAGSGSYTVSASGAATINGSSGGLTAALSGSGASVTGGSGALTVSDVAGGNTITGGSGAFSVNAAIGRDVITTGTSAFNRVVLGSGLDTVTVVASATVIGGSGGAIVTLNGSGGSVIGGSGILQVGDAAGGNTIVGGSGAFAVASSIGSDNITTGSSNTNRVALGHGNDTVTVGEGDSTVIGGNGDGKILLKGSNNLILGKSGGLSITDLVGQNSIVGGTAAINVIASLGNDSITTNNTTGTSMIVASGGSDTIIANGRTSITAGKADITVSGSGDLSINGGAGSITLTGGAGSDFVLTQTGTKNLLNLGGGKATVLNHGADTINAGSGAVAVYVGGTAVINGATNTISVTGNGDVSVNGAKGNITLASSIRNAYVFTQAGTKNLLNLGSGKGVVLAHGADTINAGSGAANIYASTAVLVNGGSGTLAVNGQSQAVTVNGGTGAVKATAGSGGGYIKGGSNGGNVLNASAGNTTLVGGGDGDTLTSTSTSGTVTFVAGAGNETLTGSSGATDLFVLTQSSLAHGEVIRGFTVGTDQLRFVGFGATPPIASQQVVGGNLALTLADNAKVTLTGITTL